MSEIQVIDDDSDSIDNQLANYQQVILGFIDGVGLPSEGVLVDLEERKRVISNIPSVLKKLDLERLNISVYISKFIVATASGLFDAALNYLWDETIYDLRKRVALFDLEYFFDVAVGSNSTKRKGLSSEQDLDKISDYELILGANKIGVISDFGYSHLDYIRYMRNWASAAHPNHNEVTGLQLITMLETCITQVITLPLSPLVVQTKLLLANIKNNDIDSEEAQRISGFFIDLPQDKANSLASGFFGIYTQAESTIQIRQNIKLLLPNLWDMVGESTKFDIGIKWARFNSINDQVNSSLAKEFLEIVNGLPYLPESSRIIEIGIGLDNLIGAHNELNNFYNEPIFAREIQRLIGSLGIVPDGIREKYVLDIVDVFITNGNGIAWSAEPIYLELLNSFSPVLASIAVFSFVKQTISSKLQFELCQEKFIEMINIMKEKVTIPVVIELIEDILTYDKDLNLMREDQKFILKVTNIKHILLPKKGT